MSGVSRYPMVLSALTLLLLAAALSACSPKFNREGQPLDDDSHSSTTVGTTPKGQTILFDGTAQGGRAGVTATANFGLSRVSVGGNMGRVKGTAPGIILTGGVNVGP